MALDGDIEAPVLDATMALGSLQQGTEYVLFRVVEPPIPLLTPLAASPSRLGQPMRSPIPNESRESIWSAWRSGSGRRPRGVLAVGPGARRAGAVLELARETGADCIAVGTHGAAGLERLLLGRVAEKVVRDTRLPVLVSPRGQV